MKLIQPPEDSSVWYAVGRDGALDRFGYDMETDSLERYLNLPVTTGREGGFLAAVFHPNWPVTKEIFVSYTITASSFESRLSRLTISDDSSLPATYEEQNLLTVVQPQSNHNGGDLAIGPDGFLYWGIGDGGGSNDPNNFSQNDTRLLGKILRVDAIDVSFPSPGYNIPPTNPNAGANRCGPASNDNNCPETYASGFRNPWRMSFDGDDFWVADVGQNDWEEVDLVTLGGNFGWRCREGANDFNTSGCPSSGLIDPVHEYTHSNGNGSITGGFVYRGTQIPYLQGKYLFADYLSGRIWSLTETQPGSYTASELIDTSLGIASFSQDNAGEVYVLGISTGRIYKLEDSGGVVDDNVAASLSGTGCVDPNNPTQLASGLIPYAPAAPFWSDGALKRRWIGLPDGSTIDVSSDQVWAFPPGTVLIKNFELAGALIETRLLMRHPDGDWQGYTYEWRSDQADADRIDFGKTLEISEQTWTYPSQGECFSCHTGVAGIALGAETAQLNSDFEYASTGITDNQLEVFNHIGIFSLALEPVNALPALENPMDTMQPLVDRARAYLHTNCAQCHQPGGPTGSGIDLRYSTPLGQTGACDQVPQAGDLGIIDPRIIAPGSAERSVLIARVNSRGSEGMPPLASTVVDTAGVQLLTEWVNELTTCF